MKSIGQIRIDDRLIHGQIVASWIQVLGSHTIVVADDNAAGDPLQKMLLEMAVPQNIKLHVLPVTAAAQYLGEEGRDLSKTLLILRDAASTIRLIEAGFAISELNVGNVSAAKDRKRYTKAIFLDDKELADYKKLNDLGVKMEVRVVPNEKATDMMSLIG